MKEAIKIDKLIKKYDEFTLGPIDLKIPSGVIIGLIGENGAGKTTIIKSLLKIIQKDEGNIYIFDKNMDENEQEIKENIGVVLDNMFFPELLNSNDINITMKGIYQTWDEELYFQYMKQFSLPLKKAIKTFSKGMRKKLEIAVALSHHPKLLILDEPTSGLDPVVRSEILDIFLNFVQDEDHTILLSTHITSDLEHIADYIIFIDKGKIVFNENRDTILENYAIIRCDEKQFNLLEKQDIIRYRKNKYNMEVLINNKKAIMKKYKEMTFDKASLEDIMVLYIKGVR